MKSSENFQKHRQQNISIPGKKYIRNKYISLQHVSSASLSKEMYARLIGFTVDFKLPLGVNVNVCGCCVSKGQPCADLATCPGCTLPSLSVSLDRLRHKIKSVNR